MNVSDNSYFLYGFIYMLDFFKNNFFLSKALLDPVLS